MIKYSTDSWLSDSEVKTVIESPPVIVIVIYMRRVLSSVIALLMYKILKILLIIVWKYFGNILIPDTSVDHKNHFRLLKHLNTTHLNTSTQLTNIGQNTYMPLSPPNSPLQGLTELQKCLHTPPNYPQWPLLTYSNHLQLISMQSYVYELNVLCMYWCIV